MKGGMSIMTEARLMRLEMQLRIPILLTVLFFSQLFFRQLYSLMLMTGLYENLPFRIAPVTKRVMMTGGLIMAHLLTDRFCLRILRAWKRFALRLGMMSAAMLLMFMIPAAFFEILLFFAIGYFWMTSKPK